MIQMLKWPEKNILIRNYERSWKTWKKNESLSKETEDIEKNQIKLLELKLQ